MLSVEVVQVILERFGNLRNLSIILFHLCREKLLLLREESDKKIKDLEGQCQELRLVISQVSEDFQKVYPEHKPFSSTYFLSLFIKGVESNIWVSTACFPVTKYGVGLRGLPQVVTGWMRCSEGTTAKGQTINKLGLYCPYEWLTNAISQKTLL